MICVEYNVYLCYLPTPCQFVEGTGSNSNASGLLQNFIAAQLPNMRFTYPLSNDSRHIINVNLDYRFADNDGPMIGNSRIYRIQESTLYSVQEVVNLILVMRMLWEMLT